jgi:hypothetical protein
MLLTVQVSKTHTVLILQLLCELSFIFADMSFPNFLLIINLIEKNVDILFPIPDFPMMNIDFTTFKHLKVSN